GKLTSAAAAEIAQAATVAPQAEAQLLKLAADEGIAGLRQEARRVMAQACVDEKEKGERLHKARYLRSYTDAEGAWRFEGRLAPEPGGEVKAVLDAIHEKLFLQARSPARKEPAQALAADALLEMARACKEGASDGPKALVNVRVDYAALKRGHTSNGEVCEIPGVGPISVAAAQDYLSDCVLKVLVTKGKDVVALASAGYSLPAGIRSALVEIYPECVVFGCNQTKRLENDHVIPWPEGPSSLDNLVRICGHHHRLKTFKGYRLGPRKDGKAPLSPPNGSRSRASPG
ncbi:MAG: HNH endonuclease signature motif containing protein, partial [Acidimicrobiia bacterium]